MAHPTFSSPFTRDLENAETMEVEISKIKGNAPYELKRACLAGFRFFVSTRGNSYGAEVGERLKMVEMNIWGDITGRSKKQAQVVYADTVFEITVEKDMCNVRGTLHGGCTAYMMDPCSVSSLAAHGSVIGIDGSGVSTSMHIVFHQPVQLGAKLRIVSTSVSMKGRIRTARCEIWDGEVLAVSAIHSTVNPTGRRAKGKL